MSETYTRNPVDCSKHFNFKPDNDERFLEIKDRMISVRKEKNLIDQEMTVYEAIKDVPNIPKVRGLYRCTNDYGDGKHWDVITYDLFIPNAVFNSDFKTNASVVKYFRDVLESYMHLINKNVIHNDLKPDNVLLNPVAQKFVLCDFDQGIILDSTKPIEMNLHSICNDFSRLFRLFEPQTVGLVDRDIMSDIVFTLDSSEFKSNFSPEAFTLFYRANRKTMNMKDASKSFVKLFFDYINESITRLDRMAASGHGGKHRRTNNRRTNNRRTNNRRTNNRRKLTNRRRRHRL